MNSRLYEVGEVRISLCDNAVDDVAEGDEVLQNDGEFALECRIGLWVFQRVCVCARAWLGVRGSAVREGGRRERRRSGEGVHCELGRGVDEPAKAPTARSHSKRPSSSTQRRRGGERRGREGRHQTIHRD